MKLTQNSQKKQQKIWIGIDPGLALIGWSVLKEIESYEPMLIDYGTIETSRCCSLQT
jgi:crossover junction endodeoxyribonuclease RuvC